ARTRCKQLLAASPANAKLLIEASRVEFAAGNDREGMRLAESAAQPKDASLDAIFHLYDLFMADGNLDKAYDLALRAASKEETNFDALDRLAKVQLRMNKRDDVRVTLRRMSETSLYDVDKQLRTAGYMASIGQYSDVEYVLFKALQQNPKDRTVRLAQVDNSLRKESYTEAYERASSLIANAHDFAPAYYLRGEAQLALRRFDAALADFDSANRVEPSTDAVLGGYRVLRAAGRADEARARLQARQTSHPQDLRVRMTLAEDLIQGGQFALARDAFKAILEQRPDDPALLNNYAYVCLQLDEIAEALRAAEQAHRLAPDNAMVSDTLGWALVKAGRREEGLPHLRDAAARASGDGEIHYHLAATLLDLGRREEARAEFERATAIQQPFESRDKAQAALKQLQTPSP
ncbi:unnamed protein product, partial [Phaeothamnion confervicola]